MHTRSIHHRHRAAILLAAPVLLLLATTVAQADSRGHDRYDREHHDHDRARHALSRGEVLPIVEILARVSTEIPGDVIDVEFEHADRRAPSAWQYELKIITPDGHVLEVLVDAATGRILEVEDD